MLSGAAILLDSNYLSIVERKYKPPSSDEKSDECVVSVVFVFEVDERSAFSKAEST